MAIVPMMAVLAGLFLLIAGLTGLWLRLGSETPGREYRRHSVSRRGPPLDLDLDLVALALATGRDIFASPSPDHRSQGNPALFEIPALN